ncbi:hypothetical protein J471_4392, partial [Acinetobacter baumannii 1032359]
MNIFILNDQSVKTVRNTHSALKGKKLIAVLAISFCWCYLTGEWKHDQKKAIKIKKHGRLSMSLFRY